MHSPQLPARQPTQRQRLPNYTSLVAWRLRGAPHGVRVNSVNPDAVLSGSKIWNSEWRSARARDHGVSEDKLADHYRSRSLLNKEVLPRDVAEAVYFFAGPDSAKSTGNILNVDAGNAAAFPR